MADTWFRFYNYAVNDPKVQRLKPQIFKFWVNILCIASKNSGAIPHIEDISFSVRLGQKVVEEYINILIANRLIHKAEHGFVPHNWDTRQYKSDGSTERVKRFRERSKAVSETLHETGPDQTISEQIQKKEDFSKFVVGRKNGSRARVTILDPQNRLAIFQRNLADEIGKNGWMIVGHAADPNHDLHARSLAICKDAAKRLGKGWPHQWPK